jgi:hypothetical protein
VATVDPPLAGMLQPATELTPYGVQARYPSDQPEPGEGESRRALEAAREVQRAILALLPAHPPGEE